MFLLPVVVVNHLQSNEGYTLFTGCSYTAGEGFSLLHNDDSLWVNLLYKNHPALAKTTKINDSMCGRSNSNIFARTVYNLTHYNIKYAFVQWTSVPRLEFSVGLETYNTRQLFIPNLRLYEHNLNDVTYSRKYLEALQNRVITLMHDHYEIVKLVEYVNSLVKLCKFTGTQLFFVNGLCHWDNKFFDRLTDVLPNKYTNYTKELINVDNRADSEIFELYEKIHNEYDMLGGVNQKYWINLYSSLKHNLIDTNDDNLHPGVKSNQNTYREFLNIINERIK
jgi:hypothetical protein